MKSLTRSHGLFRALVAGCCIAAVSAPPPIQGCAGSSGPACLLSASPCLKSLSLAKSAPTGMGLVGFPGGTVTLVFTLSATCPSCPTTPCATPATPTAATVSVDFVPGGAGACPPGPPVGPPTFSFAGPVATPTCSSNGAFTTYTVVVPVPAATPLGAYCAYGTVTVTFSDGMILSASGDTVVCIVAPVAGMPGVPRLSLTLLTPSAPRMAPGDVAVVRYSVKNNDPTHSVTLMATAGSRQSSIRPQGGNERQGVFAISSPFGDDFPIVFNPGNSCIPLPDHPYTQAPISNTVPVIPPGGTNVITVGIRSYGQCASGSCSESTLKVSGTFADGSPALACAGMALVVDSSVPSTSCAQAVNDCNNNGIPDALDIAAGRSQDRNFNAMPDECEQIINVPTSTSVSPTNPQPTAPILVRVAFNEAAPMTTVWGNGQPLTRMTIGGIPFWEGTVPADTRPGPQTVYFLGRDQQGGMSTTIVTYTVQAPNTPPTISDIPNQIVPQNSSTGPLPFTVGDAQTPAGSLVVTATSSNPTLVPNASILLGGVGANRTVTVTPSLNQSGAATITVTVADGNGGTASDTFIVTVLPSGILEVFSPTGNPTPPNAVYASPSNATPVTFPNGIVIRNISHGRLRFHPVPPVLNALATYATDGDVRFELSLNGGSTFTPITAPADVVVSLRNTADDGTTRTFQTEMFSLNIAGGSLPAGVRVRESPTLISPGQATSRLVATGGAMVSSFFDVRLEVSLNNGATWTPAAISARVALAMETPEVFSVTANPTPPNAVYAGPNPALVTTNQNLTRIRGVSHGRLRLHPPPPPLGSNILYNSDGEVRLEIALPGGGFSNVVAPATVAVRMTQVKDDGVSMFFDTEMLSLDIAGGNLAAGVRLRESPSRQSLGRATARFVRGGGAQVSSFFDVELEASLNNGGSYQPFLTRVRIELATEAPENLSPSANPTPPNFSYNTPLNPPLVTAATFGIRRVRHGRLALHPPPPPVGGSLVYTSTSTATIEFTRDSGLSYAEGTGTGNVSVRITGVKNDGTSLFFDTEMLSLDIAGGTLPAGVRLRESATLKSTGRATGRFVENAATLASSFFDVNIEATTNNGQVWFPANRPIRVELTAEAPENSSPSDNLTPVNSAYISRVGAPSINYGGGLFTRDYIHYGLALHPPIPPLGSSLTYTSTSLARFEVSQDGERTYQEVLATAATTVRMTHVSDVGPTRHFDTEMLALDFSGGTLPSNVRIRVSPTRPSRGQASVRLLNPDPAPPGLGPQTVWGLSSFFDLNTDISVDGGMTWRSATASQRVVLDGRAPQNYSPTDNLTPPNSAYVSPPNAPFIPYTNGIITRSYTHFRLAPHPPLPPPGATQTWTSGGIAQFQVTLDGGATWLDVVAQANTTVTLGRGPIIPEPVNPPSGTRYATILTELTQLDIFGGNLPPGVRLRISPTRPSRGQATVRRVGGGFELSSFFDIWTQLSLDNGATWHDAKTDQRVQLDSRGLENFSRSGNLTPDNSAYVSAPDAPSIRYSFDTSIFATYDVATRDYVHYQLGAHPSPPPPGGSNVYTSGGIADFLVSVNGGGSFVPVRANAQTTVRMTHSADVHGPQPVPWVTQIFDTEMLQLDISGGNLPNGLRIRVSPTRPARGQATVEQVDGGYRVSSFFDLWTDMSLDGGQTWVPSINPQRVSLNARAPETKLPLPDLTPANSAYVSLPNAPAIIYPGNIITRNYIHGRLLPHPPPPPLGSNLLYTTPGQAVFEVSTDGGNSFTVMVAQASTTVRMNHVADLPLPPPSDTPVMFFETEMLQLDIFGGNLPSGVRLRVSPTLPSRGQATLRRMPPLTGTPPPPIWDVASSFFDIFTEISLNNGQTWMPAVNAQRIVLDGRAPESLHPTPVLPPPGVSYNTILGALPLRYANGLITRNYRHRLLTNTITPPPLGAGQTYSALGTEILFDYSANGGLNFQSARALANVSLLITHSEDAGGIQHYDTEMLSLTFTGGDLPPGVSFRESPTRRSTGQTTIRQIQSPTGPLRHGISSFFDIWTDVSLDGGQTWSSADSAAHVVAVGPPVLSIGLEGIQAVISWDPDSPDFQLQTAPDVLGRYLDVLNATNPYRARVTNDPPQRFYRIKW